MTDDRKWHIIVAGTIVNVVLTVAIVLAVIWRALMFNGA